LKIISTLYGDQKMAISIGRPKRTWQDTLKEDLDTLGVDANDARDTANDRTRWRQLVAQCSDQNGRN